MEFYKEYLTNYVENRTEKSRKNRSNYICPLCGSGTGTGESGAFSIDKKDPTKWKCFSCGESGDLIDLIEKTKNVDKQEALRIANDLYGNGTIEPIKRNVRLETSLKDFTSDLTSYFNRVNETDYFLKRGFSKETIEDFKLGYDGKNAIIPFNKYSYLARGIGSDFKRNYGSPGLFNLQDLYNEEKQPVFICEGWADALSVYECEGYAVSTNSVENYKKLIKQLQDRPTNNPLIVAYDNDESGKKYTGILLEELKKLKVTCKAFDYNNFKVTCKDLNEYLQRDKTEFSDTIKKEEDEIKKQFAEFSDPYKKGYAINKLDAFLKEIKEKKNEAIPTGFKELDKALDGGIFPGLFILGAESSLGKSTLVLNIAEQLADQGQDVIYFSLEMATRELIARSLSKLTFLFNGKKLDAPGNKTTKQILKGNPEEYKEEIEAYKKIAGSLVLYEDQQGITIDDVVNYATGHKEETGKTPIIILDYLQLIAPRNANDTDKMKMDYSVKALKQLSQKLNTPVIAISSVNRAGYGDRVDMKAFKESGAIEFSSDVLLGLNLETTVRGKTDAKEIDEALHDTPRKMVLEVLKNRNGERNKKISFLYYSGFNYFEDLAQNYEDFKASKKKSKISM